MTIRWQRQDGNLVFQGNFGQIIKGDFHATLPGYAMQLRADRTWFERGNVDDGGAVLSGTGAAYLFGSRRLLLTALQTGNNSFFGGCDRLSIAADQTSVGGVMGAHWGFLEFKSGGKSQANNAGCGAVRGDIKLVTGSYALGIVSSFLAACEDLSGTHTAHVTVIHVPNPQAGTFDNFIEFGSATGCTVNHATPGADAPYDILISINGSPYALRAKVVGT